MQSDTIPECPSPDTLLLFVSGQLDERKLDVTTEHLRHCSRCETLVRQIAQAKESGVAETNEALNRLLAATVVERATVRADSAEAKQPDPTQSSPQDAGLAATSTVEQPVSRRRGSLEEVEVGHTLGDFHLVQSLGAGSFAKVFLARQESLQWLVALKVSKQKSDEAPTLARMDHAHIVRIHGQYPLPEKQLLLVSTKYIPGGTLDNVLNQVHSAGSSPSSGRNLLKVVDGILDTRGESPPAASSFRKQLDQFDWPQTICWLGAKLASALDHAHQHNVLHRDIKPANVLLTAEGGPMLADFNISFSSEVEGADADKFFGGSLLYMSPEQLEACNPSHSRTPDQLDGRSDIYSLGLMLWELLTGKHPFIDEIRKLQRSSDFRQMALMRRQGVPDSAIEQLPKETSPGLKHALLKCLEPEPADRFAEASELAGILEKQLIPRMRELLYPPAESWRNHVVRHPLLFIVVFGLIPNLLLTPVNIVMNVEGIINQTSQVEQDAFWERLMPLVNAITWPLPIILLLVYAWPMLKALKQYRESNSVSRDYWRKYGGRILKFGLATSVVIFVVWLVSGIAFPFGVDLAEPEGDLGSSQYVQFIVSQALHALIAAAGTYFLVTFLCIRVIYPRLIPEEPPPNNAQREISLVARCNAVFMGILGISPLLAILALATIFWDKSPELRFVFVWLALLGEIGFLVAWVVGEKLKPDLETLRTAVRPSDEVSLE